MSTRRVRQTHVIETGAESDLTIRSHVLSRKHGHRSCGSRGHIERELRRLRMSGMSRQVTLPQSRPSPELLDTATMQRYSPARGVRMQAPAEMLGATDAASEASPPLRETTPPRACVISKHSYDYCSLSRLPRWGCAGVVGPTMHAHLSVCQTKVPTHGATHKPLKAPMQRESEAMMWMGNSVWRAKCPLSHPLGHFRGVGGALDERTSEALMCVAATHACSKTTRSTKRWPL